MKSTTSAAPARGPLAASNRFSFKLICAFLAAFSLIGEQRVSAQAVGAANVTFQWTDRGSTTHALRSTWVTGVEDDSPLSPEAAGTGFTNNSGVFVFTGSDALPLLQFETEFRGDVQGFLGAGMTAYAEIRNTTPTVYFQNWPPAPLPYYSVPDPPGSANFTYTVDNSTNAGKSLGMMQAVKFMRDYYVGKGLAFPYLKINYDSTTDGSVYDETTSTIRIDANDWASWDVIMHEVGHHVAFHNNLDGPYGGPHNYGQENINLADPAPGARRAYGEGVGTFLNQLAVKDGNLAAAIPGLPAKDYDAYYDQFATAAAGTTQNDTDNIVFRVSFENLTPITGTSGQNLGEGDELSVMRVLYDVFDSDFDTYQTGFDDAIDFGGAGTLGLMAGADIFEDFWDNLAAAALADPTKVGVAMGAPAPLVLSTLGETLQEYNIGMRPLDDFLVTSDRTPQLRFAEQNNDRSGDMKYMVWNSDFSQLVDSFAFDDSAGLSNWYWDVVNPLKNGIYHWTALANSAIDLGVRPPGGDHREWYWASMRTFTVVPEPSVAVLAWLAVAGCLGIRTRQRCNAIS